MSETRGLKGNAIGTFSFACEDWIAGVHELKIVDAIVIEIEFYNSTVLDDGDMRRLVYNLGSAGWAKASIPTPAALAASA
jgi:hypothetical protein